MIPKTIQNLGADEGLQSRLKTTFDLIERTGVLSSKKIEDKLNEIRKNFTPSVGKDHGRVLLRRAQSKRTIQVQAITAYAEWHCGNSIATDFLQKVKSQAISA